MPVSWDDLLLAFEYVSFDDIGEHGVFLCRETGKLYWSGSDGIDEPDELPDDLDDSEKYLQIPGRRDLDLGRPLVMDFVYEVLPDDVSEVEQIFRRKGAYRKFKVLLERRQKLDEWYAFEAKAQEQALREWCELHEVEIGE
ncbi:MAG TPA: UPF0158 family protein [Beijerinckiaceae bacterium]|jgi:hypothetical protein|nr:UPF0158 family protein [Beijerinckiaceae bacterium]